MQFLHDSHVTSTQFAFKRLKRQDHDVDPIETIKLNSDKEKKRPLSIEFLSFIFLHLKSTWFYVFFNIPN